jgi:acetyl esterase/lipase
MKTLLSFLTIFFMNQVAHCQQTIPLYPDAIPNSKSATNTEKEEVTPGGMHIVSNISIPTLMVYAPANAVANGTAVIICPGGGYHINAIKHEGTDVAEKFNEWGITAFVLKYRIPDDRTMINKELGPLQDAQQAIRMVRDNAAKWNVDPKRIGIMGFSAGGHLAASAATHFNRPVIPESKKADLRPDFLILGYPVISFTDSIGHIGSRDNLLGKSPSSAKIREYSNELLVTRETPPTFIIHAGDDDGVKPANSIAFYQSLLKHGIAAELHIYEKGGHGFGMDNPTTKEKWMETLRNWLISNSFIGR